MLYLCLHVVYDYRTHTVKFQRLPQFATIRVVHLFQHSMLNGDLQPEVNHLLTVPGRALLMCTLCAPVVGQVSGSLS